MRQFLLVGITTGLLLLGGVVSASATIITTATGINGYEWLTFDETKDMSRNEIDAELIVAASSQNHVMYKYRYATIDETAMLLNSYLTNYEITEYDDGFHLFTYQAAFNFLADFLNVRHQSIGDLAAVSRYSTSFMYGKTYKQGYNPTRTFLGKVMYDSPISGVNKVGWFDNNWGSDPDVGVSARSYRVVTASNQWTASLLVRTPSPVPEPATILLFGLGLLGLAGVNRRKQ